jgi:hypothetical protein
LNLKGAIKKSKHIVRTSIDKRALGLDLKNVGIYGTNVIDESINTVDIKTAWFCATVRPKTCHFIGQEELELFLDFDAKKLDFTKYTFPQGLKKLKIMTSPGEGIINYNPGSKSHVFDYTKFLKKYSELIECILLFDCVKIDGEIMIPNNLTRFGVLAMDKKKNQVINLSQNGEFGELLIWKEKAAPSHDQLGVTIIPPISKKLDQLVIQYIQLRNVKGFEEFTHIETLVIYGDCWHVPESNSTREHAEELINMLKKTNVDIENLIFVNCHLVRDLYHNDEILEINPKTKCIVLQECIFNNLTVRGDGLTDIHFVATEITDNAYLTLPDNVPTIVSGIRSLDFIEHFPEKMRYLKLFEEHDDDNEICLKIKHKCEISFVKKKRYMWTSEEILLNLH